ncbi:unnamed protein product, partial [Phaeothamnion confervicola]
KAAERLVARSPKSAESLYRSLLDLDPGDFRTSLGLAVCYLRLNDVKRAESILSRLVARTDSAHELDFERALIIWAAVLQKQGQGDKAVIRLADFVNANPWKVEVRLALASLYDHTGKRAQARALIEQGLEANPGEAQLTARKGTYYRQDGALDMAGEYYRSALKSDRTNQEAQQGLKELHQ